MTNHQDINTSYHCKETSSFDKNTKENQQLNIFECFNNSSCKDFDLLKFAEAQLTFLNIKFLKNDLNEFKDRINELTSNNNAIFLNPAGSSKISSRLFHSDLMVKKLMHKSIGFSKCVTFLENFKEPVFDDYSCKNLNLQQATKTDNSNTKSTCCQCVCKYIKVCSLVYLIYAKSLCNKEEPTLADLMYIMSLNYTDTIHDQLIEPTEKEEYFMQEILGVDSATNKELESLNKSLSHLSFEGSKRLSSASEHSTISNTSDDLYNPNQVPIWMPDNIHELYFVYKTMENKSQDSYLKVKTREVHKVLKGKNCKINDHKKRKLSNNNNYTYYFNIKDHEGGKNKDQLKEKIEKDPYNAVVVNILESLLH